MRSHLTLCAAGQFSGASPEGRLPRQGNGRKVTHSASGNCSPAPGRTGLRRVNRIYKTTIVEKLVASVFGENLFTYYKILNAKDFGETRGQVYPYQCPPHRTQFLATKVFYDSWELFPLLQLVGVIN